MWSRSWLWVLFAATAWLLSWTLGGPPEAPEPPSRDVGATCQPVPPSDSRNRADRWESSFSLFRNGYVRLKVCGPGTLSLELDSSVDAGLGAYTYVGWKDAVLWESHVTGVQRLEAQVTGPGWIVIAFLNDGTEGGVDRNLWIRDVAFEPAASS